MTVEQLPPPSVSFSSLSAGQAFTAAPGSSNIILKTSLPAGTSGEAVQLGDGAPLTFAASAQVWVANAKVVEQL